LSRAGVHRSARDARDGADRECRWPRSLRRQGRWRERDVLRSAGDRQRAGADNGRAPHRPADDPRARLARAFIEGRLDALPAGRRSLVTVGVAARRVDTPEKATGRARFISDVVVAGMVHAKLWRSPVPHAKITAIDTSRAEKAPGVIAVLTATDLPVKDLYYGPAFKDQPLLADGVIRHAGEPVVAVGPDTAAHLDA